MHPTEVLTTNKIWRKYGNKKKPKLSRSQQIGILLLGVAGIVVAVNYWVLVQLRRPKLPLRPYSEFLGQVDRGEVVEVLWGRSEIRYALKREGNQVEIRATTPIPDPDLPQRLERAAVAQEDLKEAIERVVAGLEKKSRVLNEKEKKIVAYHGSDKHVVMAQLTRQAFVVIMHKIPNRANVIFQFFRE